MTTTDATLATERASYPRLEYRHPDDLSPNPKNWRTHPEAQKQALAAGILSSGWAVPLIYNERFKRLIDGHARREVAIQLGMESVPVYIVDVDEEAEERLLASIDTIGQMAGTDKATLAELLASVQAQDTDLTGFFNQVAENHHLNLLDQAEKQPKKPPREALASPRSNTKSVSLVFTPEEHARWVKAVNYASGWFETSVSDGILKALEEWVADKRGDQ